MTEPVYVELLPEQLAAPNADEHWLQSQMNRVDPHRMEMGSSGEVLALRKLALELRDKLTGAAGVLNVKRTHPDAKIPAYQTAGAACIDLHALDDGSPHPADDLATIYRTGLSFEVPPGWVMEIDCRSSHGFIHAMRLSNCSGQIDSDYRGEVMVALRYDGNDGKRIVPRKGDRIAQAKLVPAPQFQIVEVEELSETERGTGGFGSTGT